jgi:4-aminobutyrate aminotransferase-like enzyme
VVIEPVAGEGGFIPVSHDAMGQIRTFCDDNDIVMVADEVQTGFGRTGSLFSMEQFEVEPDLISLAKSIAGGLPLSGVVGRSEIMDSAHVGGIGGTFGGNPVSCAAALAVLDIMEDERLPERALVIGKEIIEMINILKKDVPWISEVRGLGAMQGICIIDDQGNPDKEHAYRIHQSALNSGLVMITAGTYGNIIRTLMPLVITEEELEESLEILSSALKIL